MYSLCLTLLIVFTLSPHVFCEETQRNGKLGVVTGLTGDLLGKQTTNSQVLSLNLTNLVILLVLKALIFGASVFGYGHGGGGGGGGGGYGRSVENGDNLITETEVQMILGYLMGDSQHKYECLYQTACQDTNKAKEYLVGSRMMLHVAKFFNKKEGDTSKYDEIVSGLNDAVQYGTSGGDCSRRYVCNTQGRR